MKNLLLTSIFLVFALLTRGRAESPNIVLILTDDQGWTDTSVPMMADRPDSRSDFYRTPHLQRLAREGMVFSNAYSPAPVCSPTRDSIFYGQTPARLHHAVLTGNAAVSAGALTLPQAIKAADSRYVAAHFGKWGCSPPSPEAAGFDISDGRTDNLHGDWQAVGDKRPLPEDDPKRIFSLTQRAGDFMEQQVEAGRPFYLQISHYACHVGHQSLEETREKCRNLPRGAKCGDADYRHPSSFSEEKIRCGWMLNYAAMIEDLDAGLGTLLNRMDQLGIAGNTYVVYTSDNGGGFRGNAPLRGGKADLWEGGIRVPMVVRGPGVKSGSYCDLPVVGWDFWPTFRELAGGEGPIAATARRPSADAPGPCGRHRAAEPGTPGEMVAVSAQIVPDLLETAPGAAFRGKQGVGGMPQNSNCLSQNVLVGDGLACVSWILVGHRSLAEHAMVRP